MTTSTTTANNILNLYLRAVAISNLADNASSSPTVNVYVAQATASYVAGGNQSANEASWTGGGGGYARIAVPRSTAGGAFAAAASGATSNQAAIDWDTSTSSQTVTSVSVGKSSSGATDYFWAGDLSAPISISSGVQPRFAIGALTITIT
jgi:hypothetical protein